MKYIEDFRNGNFAKVLSKEIAAQVNPNQFYQFMEFCGGHTHAIHRYGIPSLLPNNIEMIHGPGCPVCVLPMTITDKAIALSSLPNVILSTYADMMRVPGTGQKTLLHAKALGADIRMIYSANDALKIAQENPQKEVIFFAIGFETTTPPTALVIKQAKKLKLSNFSVFCNHVLTPVAMDSLLQSDEVKLDGFVGPAHVSIVIGSKPYEAVCKKYHKPIVISGFEPLDLLHSILMLIKQLNEKRCEVEIQYTRAVNHLGNAMSQEIMAEVLELRDQFEWRGLGFIPKSALKIRAEYAEFDAEQRFQLPDSVSQEHKQCLCGEVLRGVRKPMECKLFAKACVPENPLGSCMVSSEGACAAVYAYGRINA
ncbi:MULTISPECIES: hydrogenase formation protein HypD [Legionella]|uniref:Hydrogenase maturation factor n=1 Tax=Legionella resiliens TaxID=2905958 RepID=A0ABS8X0W0_9GAMM|nr:MULTISPECIES: hydrogenase formation protein HypD [unclassified Legionella]MCE0723215.1 hydrogenase formation protein HypD [Legionella sp. 9fVS26]MCE3532368.1 hydrogenase formation protein HypD [Legionella sp. 8cVS16]QLZ68508.1 Hydrogenase maturation factor HypD [Legionella sp. PC1000]